jgi:uncharacterized RDD family membrane protein YckC
MTANIGPQPTLPCAGFWRRFGALIVDAITLLAIDTAIRFAVGSGVGRPLSVVFALAYFTVLVGSRGQTLGMRALKICVISVSANEAIGYKRAFIRWISGFISAAALLLGFLWMLWDDEKQCWHDKLASDLVVLAFPPDQSPA